MPKRPCRNHSPSFSAKVALSTVRGEQTLAELARQFDLYPNQIRQWKDQLLEGAMAVCGDAPKDAAPPVYLKELHAKIGPAGTGE